ncbi:MAG: type II toxin-antitoxin system HicB family antitoxin [Bacteroidales bacterium]|nr:type II toxin-antitoxin system HicB family antitoxin [Bacteroidales bacterium]
MSKKDLSFYLGLDYDIKVKKESFENETWFIAFAEELGRMACYGQGVTQAEAIESFLNEKDDFITYLFESKQAIPEPKIDENEFENLSGIFNIRTSSTVHTLLAKIAKENRISLNLYVNQILSAAAFMGEVENKIMNKLNVIEYKLDNHHSEVTGKLNYLPLPMEKNAVSDYALIVLTEKPKKKAA